MASMSIEFLNPMAQWIIWFISGWRRSRPTGVKGSSEWSSAADVSMRER